MSISPSIHSMLQKIPLGDTRLPHGQKPSSSIGLLNEALRLDQHLPVPHMNNQHYPEVCLENPDIVAPDGSKVDFDKINNIIEKIGKVLDEENSQRALSYFEYYSIVAQLVIGGYGMYVGKPKNPKDVEIFKKEMNQFLGAFVDGCAEDLLQKKT